MLDGYLAEFAKELIVQEALGQDQSPDYLGLSFSAPDLVGHSYGPNSPELLDTLIRLDTYIGRSARLHRPAHWIGSNTHRT